MKACIPQHKKLCLLLLIFSVLASLKMIFVSLGMDEEYQLVMAYRNVRGDRLFLDMWEPHQSSAFLCALLMKPWLALFGTAGVVLYLRICGTLLHLCVSLYLYRVLKDSVDAAYAWLLALIYYNTIPKQIILPEFGIMQVWCYTLTALFFARYYARGKKLRFLILAALSLVLNVLSYPSCLILFPFVIMIPAVFSGKSKWRDMGIITLVCALCGLGYLGMLFTYTTPGELLETLSHILSGDITHSLTPDRKLLSLLFSFLFTAALWLLCLLLSMAAAKWKKLRWEQTCCLTAVCACMAVLFNWTVLGKGYETLHIHLVAFALAGLCACGRRSRGKDCTDRHDALVPAGSPGAGLPADEACPLSAEATADTTQIQRKFLKYIMTGAVLSLLAVTYLTDLSLTESIPHAMPAAFCGAVLLILAPGENTGAKNSRWIYAALCVWCLTAVFGKAYSLRSASNYNNVLQSRGIMREGPAAGIISDYMNAYIYNSDYEDWQSYIQDGDRVLIMVDLMNLSTIQYLFKDVEISHFSTVNPTAYDERLLEYWEMYPEKYPNVIIVDCWYGQLTTDPEGWLMQYIENDFGYVQVNDGKYIRIFRKIE